MASSSLTTAPSPTVSRLTLTAMVVGSMVGGGVFSLPQRFASGTGVIGAVIVWSIAGIGTLMLALVFNRLARRRPDLDAGIYAYAKAGFGHHVGFYSAAGYWASACVGNVTFWVLIMSTLGTWFPVFGSGGNLPSVLLSSAGLWAFFFLIRRGIQPATAINRIVTIAKLVPILVFVLLALLVFDPQVFADNLTADAAGGSLFDQVRSTMLVTVSVFLGVEGASVYSRYARRREHVGQATVLGFLTVLALFASVTIVSYGILPLDEIAGLRQPSMAGVLRAAVGPWGGALVGIGLIVSVLGAYLAWSLMASEVLFAAARAGDMPRFLARTSSRDVPVNALTMTTLLVQAVLVVILFSSDAFDFALNMTSTLCLVPYLLAAGYALKQHLLARSGRLAGRAGGAPAGAASRGIRWAAGAVLPVLATGYTVFLLLAAGTDLLLVSLIFYAVATALFLITRWEQGHRRLSSREIWLTAAVLLGAAAGVVSLATGSVSL